MEKLRNRILQSYEKRKRIWQDRSFFKVPPPELGQVHLHTNDYLSLTGHIDIVSAGCDALRRSLHSSLMSAVFLNSDSEQRKFEKQMAAHMAMPDAILCQSGWSANIGLLQAIASPDIPIFIDQQAHMSLYEGAMRSGAEIYRFRHNSLSHLELRLKSKDPGIIVIDSIYSTNGSLAPIQDIAKLADKYGSILVVDESHSLGTHGLKGGGICGELAITNVFVTASLSKAFGGRGGIIACPADFYEYFHQEAYTAIFSSAVHGFEAEMMNETLKIIQKDSWRRNTLHANSTTLRKALKSINAPVDEEGEQIIGIELGGEYETIHMRDLLAQDGILAAPFVPPATGRRNCVLRISVSCKLQADEISRTVESIQRHLPTVFATR